MSTPAPDRIPVTCSSCERSMSVPAKQAGRRVKCPECGTSNLIPEPDAAPVYELSSKEIPKQAMPDLTVQKQIYRIRNVSERPPAPEWTFFTHVFDFPWRTRSALIHWLKLTGLMIGPALCLALNLWLYEELGSRSLLPIGFLFMGELAFITTALAYAANSASRILQETTAGADQVEDWADGEWRDWSLELLSTGYVFLFAVLAGYVIAQPLRSFLNDSTYLNLLTGLPFLVFPVFWLSTVDSGAIWLPWSPMVAQSLVRIPKHWLLFYGLTAGVTTATLGLLLLIFHWYPWAVCVLLAPVVSTFVFLYARLLGRMAWKITADATERQPEEPEADEEEDAEPDEEA